MMGFAMILAAIQLIYWVGLGVGWRRAVDGKSGSRGSSPGEQPGVVGSLDGSPTRLTGSWAPEPISVIVAARDEESALPRLMQALRGQTHGAFEVLVVDDGSQDGTVGTVREFARSDPRFRVISNPDPAEPRKKRALMAGIGEASHDVLAFTDADCMPGPEWLASIALVHAQAEGPQVIIGYGHPAPAPGLLNRLQRYDAAEGGFLAAAAIGLDRAWLAKGSNISYRKTTWVEAGGFGSGMASMSGDDDLFVQSVRRAGNAEIAYMAELGSFVPSPSPSTWKGWVRQKLRHTSAARFYDRRTQFHLALFHGSGTLLWLAPLVAGLPGLAILLGRLIVLQIILAGPFKLLAAADLRSAIVVLDFLYAVYHTLIPPIGLLRGARRW